MATQAEPGVEPRVPLSRERVLRAAVDIADEGGVKSLTMRRLAEKLGSEPMSLYYHVANKEEVLDGVVDLLARIQLEDAARSAPWPERVVDEHRGLPARRRRMAATPPDPSGWACKRPMRRCSACPAVQAGRCLVPCVRPLQADAGPALCGEGA